MAKKQEPHDRTRKAEGGSASVPDVAGQKDMKSIKSVDLSLHGDAVSHWQDEPRSKPVTKPKRLDGKAGNEGK